MNKDFALVLTSSRERPLYATVRSLRAATNQPSGAGTAALCTWVTLLIDKLSEIFLSVPFSFFFILYIYMYIYTHIYIYILSRPHYGVFLATPLSFISVTIYMYRGNRIVGEGAEGGGAAMRQIPNSQRGRY